MLAYFQPLALAALRLFTASLVWQHAAQKLFGMFGGEPAVILSHAWFMGNLELVASLALGIGFLTRPVALLVSAEMLLVYLIQYLHHGFPPSGTNMGEQFLELSLVLAFLAFAGPGRFSVDSDLKHYPAVHAPWSAEGLKDHYPQALGAVRILMALLYAQHGLGKLGIGGGEMSPVLSERWFAGVIEVFGGAALALGLLTRPIAFVTSGQMLFAYLLSHAPRNPSPIVNGGDRAAMYSFFFLALVAAGPGRWALDGLLRRKTRPGQARSID